MSVAHSYDSVEYTIPPKYCICIKMVMEKGSFGHTHVRVYVFHIMCFPYVSHT